MAKMSSLRRWCMASVCLLAAVVVRNAGVVRGEAQACGGLQEGCVTPAGSSFPTITEHEAMEEIQCTLGCIEEVSCLPPHIEQRPQECRWDITNCHILKFITNLCMHGYTINESIACMCINRRWSQLVIDACTIHFSCSSCKWTEQHRSWGKYSCNKVTTVIYISLKQIQCYCHCCPLQVGPPHCWPITTLLTELLYGSLFKVGCSNACNETLVELLSTFYQSLTIDNEFQLVKLCPLMWTTSWEKVYCIQ